MVAGHGARRPARVAATKWHAPIFVYKSREGKRLPSWYDIDSGVPETNDFTWGYHGAGPHRTAYSILRELFGRDVAKAHENDFVLCYISKRDPAEGFEITRDEIARMLSIYVCDVRNVG